MHASPHVEHGYDHVGHSRNRVNCLWNFGSISFIIWRDVVQFLVWRPLFWISESSHLTLCLGRSSRVRHLWHRLNSLPLNLSFSMWYEENYVSFRVHVVFMGCLRNATVECSIGSWEDSQTTLKLCILDLGLYFVLTTSLCLGNFERRSKHCVQTNAKSSALCSCGLTWDLPLSCAVRFHFRPIRCSSLTASGSTICRTW